MSQSLAQNLTHIIFSTKKREPLITADIELPLHKYLASTCFNLNCHPKMIGGYTDHVHIFCNVSKNIAVSDLIRELKMYSSKWMKSEFFKRDFYWQGGYAAFSISNGHLEAVARYIDQQHQHHQKYTFQEELRKLLMVNNVEFDEKYIWD